MKLKYRIVLIMFLFNDGAVARSLVFRFTPYFGDKEITFGEKYYALSNKDSIRFDKLRFYVSSVCFYENESIHFKEVNSFHLVDATDIPSSGFTIEIPDTISFNHVKFNLGIDSLTNNAGALGGDLDPTKGMYWTWQSGYINFKIEGASSICKSNDKEFSFHLGGYSYPNNSLREITLQSNGTGVINIRIDLKKFISALNLPVQDHIMSPGIRAMELSTIAAGCFKANLQ